MKYLAIDFGMKRIGLAVSDDTLTLAFPHKVIKNTPAAFTEILDEVKKESITGVILGESKNLDMKDNSIMKSVHALKQKLEEEGIMVEFHPEFYSSAFVVSHMGEQNKSIDASAAAVILQSYLDLLKNKK
jgi:putative Holliday junction resolvase